MCFLMEIISAEVMIGDGGFMQRSGMAQVKAQNLCQAEMEAMIDWNELVEGKVLRKG